MNNKNKFNKQIKIIIISRSNCNKNKQTIIIFNEKKLKNIFYSQIATLIQINLKFVLKKIIILDEYIHTFY